MIPWFALFVWTLVLELPVYEYGAASRSRPWWHMPLVTLALNLLTHPAFTWWQLETHPSSGTVLQAEILRRLRPSGAVQNRSSRRRR